MYASLVFIFSKLPNQTTHSVPYHSIDHFSVETSGTFDGDCEMKLWIKGMSEPLKKEFKRDVDVKSLQRILATYVLK